MHIQMLPILLLLCFQLLGPAGHTKGPLSEDQAAAVTSRLNLAFSEEEPAKEGILCFDVDEDGTIALGTESHGRNWISIYDSSMVFQYAISFHSEGSFLIFLEEDHICLFLIRGNLWIEIDHTGQPVGVWQLEDYASSIAPLMEKGLAHSREVNGTVYELRNESRILNLTGKYSLLVMSSAEGGERILYDVSETMSLRFWFSFILILCLLALTGGVVMYHREKKKHN